MRYLVGPKGQVVIAKDIREQLGVKPGWQTLQRLVDDHLEVYFIPPEHSATLKGILAEHSEVRVPPGEEWENARAAAWNKGIAQKAGTETRLP